jgi:hypothetical protein
VCVEAGARVPLSNGEQPKAKKFYHRIPATPPFAAIWQRIQLAVTIRTRFKNPNRSRIPKTADTVIVAFDRIVLDRLKSDPGTPTGHQVQMGNPRLFGNT